jgi:hypothetical protein
MTALAPNKMQGSAKMRPEKRSGVPERLSGKPGECLTGCPRHCSIGVNEVSRDMCSWTPRHVAIHLCKRRDRWRFRT